MVDSGSTDGTPDAIERELPGVTVIRRPNIGFAAANNVGLRVARGRYMLLLNPDLEIVEGTLAQLVAEMDQRPEVGITSSITHYPDGELQTSIRRFPSPSAPARRGADAHAPARARRTCRRTSRGEERYGHEQSADWLSGSFLLARREAVEQAGGMDERFFLFSEETDWCRRVRTAGWDIRHLPTLRLTHHTGRTERPDLFAQNSYSKVLYARKHFRPPWPAARSGPRWPSATRSAGWGFALPALRRPELRERVAAERLALLVVLGLEAPRYRPYAERAGS